MLLHAFQHRARAAHKSKGLGIFILTGRRLIPGSRSIHRQNIKFPQTGILRGTCWTSVAFKGYYLWKKRHLKTFFSAIAVTFSDRSLLAAALLKRGRPRSVPALLQTRVGGRAFPRESPAPPTRCTRGSRPLEAAPAQPPSNHVQGNSGAIARGGHPKDPTSRVTALQGAHKAAPKDSSPLVWRRKRSQ